MTIEKAMKQKCPLCQKRLQHSLILTFANKRIIRSLNSIILSTKFLDFRESYDAKIYGSLNEIQLMAICGSEHSYEKTAIVSIRYKYTSLVKDLSVKVLQETVNFSCSRGSITINNNYITAESKVYEKKWKHFPVAFPFVLNTKSPQYIENLFLLR